jgi:hypothetical protein
MRSLQSSAPMTLSFQPTRKAINLQYSLYACNCSDGTIAYSFFGTASSGSLSYKNDIINDMIASREYLDMAKAYALLRVLGFRIRVVPSGTGADGRIFDTPSCFVAPFIGTQTISYTTAAYSDTSIEVMLSGMARAYERYYRIPPLLIGSSGYPVGGSTTYIATNQYATNANFYVIIGALSGPQFSTGSMFTKVAVVDIYMDCEFSAPFTL